MSRSDVANRLTSVNGQAYTWDNNGNLESDGLLTYSYDQANRLKQVVQGANTYTFAYNGVGDRLSQTVGITTTHYVLDPGAGLTQVLADGTNIYLYGNDRLGQYQAAMQYFGADALGSVRQIYDASGQVVGSSRYDPFGNVMSQSGATSVFAFAGEQYDAATGLEYLRAWYYSSAQGRFTTRDVWEGDPNLPMSYNAWLYAYANSVNLTDPSGRDAWWCDQAPDPQKCRDEYNSRKWPDPIILDNVKWLNQRGEGGGPNACGPASPVIVLNSLRINATLKDVVSLSSQIPPKQGGYDPGCPKGDNPVCMSAGALVQVAQRYGLKVEAHDGWSWDQVRAQLIQKHPVIADININKGHNLPVTSEPKDPTKYTGHFVVIYGMDYKAKRVYYRNPLVENVNQTTFDLFDIAWSYPVDKGDPLLNKDESHYRWGMAAYR